MTTTRKKKNEVTPVIELGKFIGALKENNAVSIKKYANKIVTHSLGIDIVFSKNTPKAFETANVLFFLQDLEERSTEEEALYQWFQYIHVRLHNLIYFSLMDPDFGMEVDKLILTRGKDILEKALKEEITGAGEDLSDAEKGAAVANALDESAAESEKASKLV